MVTFDPEKQDRKNKIILEELKREMQRILRNMKKGRYFSRNE